MNVYVKGLLNGLMVYWDEQKNAAKYYVHLVIGTKHAKTKKVGGKIQVLEEKMEFLEIEKVELTKNTKYYSFLNLAKIDQNDPSGNETGSDTGKNYFVYVEAESKTKTIIATTPKELGLVYVLKNGSYSLEN